MVGVCDWCRCAVAVRHGVGCVHRSLPALLCVRQGPREEDLQRGTAPAEMEVLVVFNVCCRPLGVSCLSSCFVSTSSSSCCSSGARSSCARRRAGPRHRTLCRLIFQGEFRDFVSILSVVKPSQVIDPWNEIVTR